MSSRKFCIYIKDEEIYKLISKTQNKSAYVERAIRFYLDNKEIMPKLVEALSRNV